MRGQKLRQLLIGEFSWKRFLRSVIFIYVSLVLYIYFFADGLIFKPPAASYDDDEFLLKIPTSQGKLLAARYFPHPDAEYTILYSHGNAEDLGLILPVLLELNHLGFSVFAYDYQGYGHSDGKTSERGTYADITAAYDYLTETLGVEPEQLIVHGRSVGGGPSVYLAEQKPVAGLILESTFTKAFRVILPFPILPFEKFPNRDRIDTVNCPVLIIHGTEDSTIPFSHSYQLFDAAQDPKQHLPIKGADHDDILWIGEQTYLNAIQNFL